MRSGLREYTELVAERFPPVPGPELPDAPRAEVVPPVLLYQRILSALLELQAAASRLESLTIPPPIINVSKPDFDGLVQAIYQTRAETFDYEKVVGLVRDAIQIPAPVVHVDGSAPAQDNTELLKALENLSFSLKGIGRMGSGGGSVSLQPGQTLQGINSPVTVTGTVTTSTPALPSTPLYERATVAVTNTAVQLGAKALTQGVIVQALSGNAASIYLGDSSVTTGNGFELQAGQATSVAVANMNALYINGTSGDGVCAIGT